MGEGPTVRELTIVVVGSLFVIGCTVGVAYARSTEKNTQSRLPMMVATWKYEGAINAGFPHLLNRSDPFAALSAVEAGGNAMELSTTVTAVGRGGKPNERNEITLDSMVMWGPTRQVGAVGCLKRVVRAISVARKVLEETLHTFLVGEDATQFALLNGFEEEDLSNAAAEKEYREWVKNGKIPNFWTDGKSRDYNDINATIPKTRQQHIQRPTASSEDHDTIGMIGIDIHGHISVGVTTNGLRHKIAGRVGDSPIPGAGGYCEQGIGGAVATGNGDIMMRFLPTFSAVQYLKSGLLPKRACEKSVKPIREFYPDARGALIVLTQDGEHASCTFGYSTFPYVWKDNRSDDINVEYITDSTCDKECKKRLRENPI